MHFALNHLFCRHAVSSYDRQLHLADLIKYAPWHFDLTNGILSFGDEYHWHAQILGTEADDSQTWLWAWANEASNIPPTLLKSAMQMKSLGEQRLIEELTEPQLPLGETNGHFFGLLASGVCQANACYRGPYEGGAVFLLIQDETFPRNTDPPLARIASVFPQAIAGLEIPNHKIALAGYLDSYGLAHDTDGNTIVVKKNGETVLEATFDELNRLSNLDVKISPPQQ